jgi:O-acetyl-ADP-ribose deacetylase (regulator of RNase III)
MITFRTGDIFKSNAQVITNTVNCVGVMGKGLALSFKERFPELFNDYVIRCEKHEVKPGKPYLWENDETQVLNFPTKRHWKENSKLEDVEEGLKFLAENYIKMGINSVALPPLGCGLGGLNWNDVKNLINKHLGQIDDLDVYVYEPETSVSDDEDKKSKQRPISKSEGMAAQQSFL